ADASDLRGALSAFAPAHDQLCGRSEVRGARRGGGERGAFLGPVTREHEGRPRAARARGELDVAPVVADHPAPREVRAELPARALEHPGRGLATGAAGGGPGGAAEACSG